MTDQPAGPEVLDHPVWFSLAGPHAALAEGGPLARRYRPDVSPFAAPNPAAGAAGWDALGELVGPGAPVLLALAAVTKHPDDWTVHHALPGYRMVAADAPGEPDPDAVLLGDADRPQMLDLVERTQPGPFAPRTPDMGTYLGLRQGGRLIAMAGERIHPPGYTEVSAVCTDPEFRGKGLARRLIRAITAGIVARGEIPFLHVAAENTNATRLYDELGFTVQNDVVFTRLRSPST